jgi:hypothetical protein
MARYNLAVKAAVPGQLVRSDYQVALQFRRDLQVSRFVLRKGVAGARSRLRGEAIVAIKAAAGLRPPRPQARLQWFSDHLDASGPRPLRPIPWKEGPTPITIYRDRDQERDRRAERTSGTTIAHMAQVGRLCIGKVRVGSILRHRRRVAVRKGLIGGLTSHRKLTMPL